MAATSFAETTGSSPYRQALTFFNERNYSRALNLLEHASADGSARERADALNLRGAIYLRQGRFDQARMAFAEAVRLDPGLWAARFNEAEVAFRQKHYVASRAQFDALLDRTSRFFHTDERRFLEYKVLLADLCAGREQPALDFIAAHRSEPTPPLAWYYLSAAVEQRHGQPQKAEEWLAQAESKPTDSNRAPYVESFERLAGQGEHSGRSAGQTALAADRRSNRSHGAADRESTARTASFRTGRSPEPAEGSARSVPPATVAMVQLMPDRSPVAAAGDQAVFNAPTGENSRSTEVPASVDPQDSTNFPPRDASLFPGNSDRLSVPPTATSPGVLARPRRPRSSATPTPSPTPSLSPAADGTTANQGANGALTASPSPGNDVAPPPAAVPASPEFTQKYEAAYVKFLEKDYPGTIALLVEADKIQPKQPQSATLRAQVFKQDYEAAYLAFRKLDYPAALAKLDEADEAQPNYPDALNLRGLIYSKQRVYDRAEAMFKRAVEADPTLWAAKFNYAELPFNRGDYTTARGRFEDLLAETDATKRPREAELTQYKVFLTLLMEGKTDQARSFMDHFNFSGVTPAKYFCNAAMNFRAGTVDKAENWINSAKREYPAQLVSIFLESFYRLGWMTDPNTTVPGGMLASASPTPTSVPLTASASPTPAQSPAVEAVTASVSGNPSPSPSPAKVAMVGPVSTPAASASPILLAASSPTASPSPTLLASSSPARTPAIGLPAVTATPTPTPLAATPAASATPVVAAASASPVATVTATPKPTIAATPAPTVPATPALTPKPTPASTATPTPTVTSNPAASVSTPAVADQETPEPVAKEKVAEVSPADNVLRWSLAGVVLVYALYVVSSVRKAAARKRARRAAKSLQRSDAATPPTVTK